MRFVLLFLLLSPLFAKKRAVKPKIKDQQAPSNDLTQVFDRMKVFSGVAYCNDSLISAWSCERCSQSDIAKDSVKVIVSPTGTNVAFLAYDKKMREIIVSFKGSSNSVNFLADALAIQVDCVITQRTTTGVKVHLGIQTTYLSLRDRLLELFLEMVGRYPDATIISTGHSLGGALASLFALEIAENYPHLKSKLKLYTFGAPRLGNSRFADEIDQYGDQVYRVTKLHDRVTQLPPRLLMGEYWEHHKVEYNLDDLWNIRKCLTREDEQCSLRDHTVQQTVRSVINPFVDDAKDHALDGYSKFELKPC